MFKLLIQSSLRAKPRLQLQQFTLSARHFPRKPRTILQDQMLAKDQNYNIKPPDPDKYLAYKSAKSKEEARALKKGDNAYLEFTQSAAGGMFDQKVEKQMDEFISSGIEKGYEDEEILEAFGKSALGSEGQGARRAARTNEEAEQLEQQQLEDLRKYFKKQGMPLPDAQALLAGKYDEFGQEQQKLGKMMYEEDEIILESMRSKREAEIQEDKQREKAVKVQKNQRSIEPGVQAGFKDADSMVIDAETYRPEQPQYYDPKAKRREHQEKFQRNQIKQEQVQRSKFESEENINLTPREQDIKMRLQAQLQKKEGLEEEDASFKAMAELDQNSHLDNEFDFDNSGNFLKGPDGYELGQAVDYHDMDGNMRQDKKPVPRIIGKTNPKVEHFTDGHPANQRQITIMDKVQKQLDYLTDVMDLDEFGKKHWYYRLKREYEEEAKIKKRLEQRQARKDFKKLMKKQKIEMTLKEEENFDSFYGDSKRTQQTKEEDDLPRGYLNEEEYRFYGDDHEFMRFHKRTKHNMHQTLQDILQSSKQTVSSGVKNMHNISITHIDLNKASSLIIAYWSINSMDSQLMPRFILEHEAKEREEELQALIDQDKAEMDEEEQAQMDQMKPIDKLQELNEKKQQQLEAEIQKKLTKAVPYFRGRMCTILGLRYAPEIRFYRDNSLELIQGHKEQARKYLKEIEDEKQKEINDDPRRQMQTTYDQIQKLKQMKPVEVKMMQERFENEGNEQMVELFRLLSNREELERIENELKEKLASNEVFAPEGMDKKQEPLTRRDKREAAKHEKWMAKVGEASGMGFEETAELKFTPEQISEAVMQQVVDTRPTSRPLKSHKGSKRFEYNDKGEKVRKEDAVRTKKNQSLSKAQRRSERSKRFFENL